MALETIAAARPRTAGEILDDAWRLYFADAAALLILSGSCIAPTFAAVLWLLAQPQGDNIAGRWLLAAAAAALAALSGLGSAACQEHLRQRSESKASSLPACFIAALKQAVTHVALRSVVLGFCLVGIIGFVPWLAGANAGPSSIAAIVGIGYLLLPAAVLWVAAAPAHAVVVSTERRRHLFAEIGRAARLDAFKAAIVVLSRAPLLLLTFFNLHLLLVIAFWAAMNLGGFDLALAGSALSVRNPVYVVALMMTCWLLLAPYFEVSNYLLYLDARTRQEGLDLLHRVNRAFVIKPRSGAAVLAIAVALSGFAPARAAESWPAAVRQVKSDVESVRAAIADADPYPGGNRWEPQLRTGGRTLDRAADNKARQRSAAWYRKTLVGFAQKNRSEALDTLEAIRQRLSLIEETSEVAVDSDTPGTPGRSKADIKSLVRQRDEEKADASTPEATKQQAEPRRREIQRAAPEGDGPAANATGAGIELPSGVATVGGLLLLGALLAVVGVAIARAWMAAPKAPPKPVKSPTDLPAEDEPRPDEQPSPVLWRQAEELARKGQHRPAVRALYLAVLSLLHSQRLVRYETTRTNGEYIRQVRLALDAPPGLAEPFERLTRNFEQLWYGGTDAGAADFEECLGLAETARALART
jgi:hypothetical protein